MGENALMKLREERVKVQALFLRDWQRLEESVEQPALAAANSAVQVQPRQGFRRSAQQHIGVLRHAVNDLLLAVAEGVTLNVRFLSKEIVDYATRRRAASHGFEVLAEEPLQGRPARYEA